MLLRRKVNFCRLWAVRRITLPLASTTLAPPRSTTVQRPFPISAPWPQLDEPDAATRRPKIVPDANGETAGIVTGPPPVKGTPGTNL